MIHATVSPVYLMTHSEHEPVEVDGTTFTFVVDDIGEAVRRARRDADDKCVGLLGGRVAYASEVHLRYRVLRDAAGVSSTTSE